MVLSMVCYFDKLYEKKLSELFRYKYTRKPYCLIQIFSAKEPA